MAVPKRRKSKSKRDQRRAHWKGEGPAYNRCPQCQKPTLPHHVCANCGTYSGRQAIEVE